MADLTGHVLKNRYRIDAYLGRGGMAEVYRAFDTKRNYMVAIKVMHPDLAEDKEFVRRFRQEADNLAALAHDNVVRFYSLEQDQGLTFLVMDYIEGVTLRTLLAQADGPLPLGQVAHIFSQMCQALHYAHEEGFVHRDVKPGNTMIRPDGRVLVSDFGIAKATDAATITTYMPGTPAYMSPEQCRSQMVDRRSDVYSLGVVLFEMVTGRKPFLGETEAVTGSTREKMRWEQVHAVPPPPQAFNPQLPAAVERVILKALVKQPEERFSTALGMLETFEIAVGDVTKVAPPVSVESPPARVSLGSSPAMEPVPETTSSTLQRWLKSAQANPTRATVIVIIALAVLGGGGWVAFGRRTAPPLTVPAQNVAMSTTEARETQPTAATHTSTPQIAARASVKLLHRTDVRAGPGEEYLVFATLDEGTPVEVTGRNSKGTWWQIIHPGGPQGRGWIDADDAEEVELSVPEVSVLPPSDAPTSTVVPTPTNTPIPTSTPMPSDTPSLAPTPTPVLPGRGQGKIAFVTNRDGNNEVYVMKADGTGQTRLTYDPGDDWSPAWSSDGQRIVFTSSRDAQLSGVHNIYIMNTDGGDVIRLTYNQAWDEYGAWSPDGQSIVFVSTADNNAEIFAVNTDGSNYQRLTYNQADDRNPSWSPDGRRLVLASRRTGTWQIFVMDADGGNQTRLTYSDANDFDPTWSPDGNRIAFVSDRDGNAEIYVMNADGSGQTKLTDNHARDEHPTWSPDGSALAFWSNREEDRNDVYVMWADGSQQTRLTSHPASDGAPSWGK